MKSCVGGGKYDVKIKLDGKLFLQGGKNEVNNAVKAIKKFVSAPWAFGDFEDTRFFLELEVPVNLHPEIIGDGAHLGQVRERWQVDVYLPPIGARSTNCVIKGYTQEDILGALEQISDYSGLESRKNSDGIYIVSGGHRKNGHEAFENGDFNAACEAYSKAIEFNSYDNRVIISLMYRAKTHIELGNWQLAVDDCNKGLEKIRLAVNNKEFDYQHQQDSCIPILMTRRAKANVHLGNHESAIKDITEALHLKPNNIKIQTDVEYVKEHFKKVSTTSIFDRVTLSSLFK